MNQYKAVQIRVMWGTWGGGPKPVEISKGLITSAYTQAILHMESPPSEYGTPSWLPAKRQERWHPGDCQPTVATLLGEGRGQLVWGRVLDTLLFLLPHL